MAIKILTDKKTKQSVMIDNVKKYAFGPVFEIDEDPQDFIDWFFIKDGIDLRVLSSDALVHFVDEWRKVEENENEARAERVYNDTATTTLNEQMENARKLK